MDISGCDSFPVYTVYIQTAQIGQKNESLSKNKCLKINQHLVANRNKFYTLLCIQTIDFYQSTKREKKENGGIKMSLCDGGFYNH